MEPEAVLYTARSGNLPSGWHVWPLRRDRVMRSLIGWAILTAIGFLLLVPTVILTVPGNFERSAFAFLATGLLLIILGAMAFGSLWIAVSDVQRLRHADQYLLVMTPDDYVMATPRKVTHVPMADIEYITLKGIKIPETDMGAGMEPFNWRDTRHIGGTAMFAGSMMRRKPKESPSLAFVDLRTDTEVIVGTDDSFDNLLALDGILRTYAGRRERTQTG